jgi:hypothetical protein
LYKYNWWQHLTDWVCVLKIITQFSASITTMYRNRNLIYRQWTRTSAMNSLKISKGKSEVGNRKISLLYQILAMKTYFVEISDGILEITIYQGNNACIAVLNLSLCFHSSLSSCQFPYFFPINRFKNCLFQSVLTNSILFKKVLFLTDKTFWYSKSTALDCCFLLSLLFFSLFIPCLQ